MVRAPTPCVRRRRTDRKKSPKVRDSRVLRGGTGSGVMGRSTREYVSNKEKGPTPRRCTVVPFKEERDETSVWGRFGVRVGPCHLGISLYLRLIRPRSLVDYLGTINDTFNKIIGPRGSLLTNPRTPDSDPSVSLYPQRRLPPRVVKEPGSLGKIPRGTHPHLRVTVGLPSYSRLDWDRVPLGPTLCLHVRSSGRNFRP